jgi:hypothetical protein
MENGIGKFACGACACICCKQVWRSEYDCDEEEWLTPTLISSDSDQECEPDVDWHVPDGECYAETTLYVTPGTCEEDPDVPVTPTIDPPDEECCDECNFCCDPPVTEASMDIAANWGSLIFNNCGGFPIAESACFPGQPPPLFSTCDVCPDVSARTVVFTFGGGPGCAAGGLVFASCPLGFTGISQGEVCQTSFQIWSDSGSCCGSNGITSSTKTINIRVCAGLYIAKHADDAGCRIYLYLGVYQEANAGQCSGVYILSGRKRYASEVITDCTEPIELRTDTVRGADALGDTCGDVCDAMPDTFTINLS